MAPMASQMTRSSEPIRTDTSAELDALLVPGSRRERNASSLVEDHMPEGAAQVDGVDLTAAALAEPGQVAAEGRHLGAGVAAGLGPAEDPRLAAGVVGEDVETVGGRIARAVVGVAAYDRGPVVGGGVDRDRSVRMPATAPRGVVARPSLLAGPAEVEPAVPPDVIDLLPAVLADVTDPQCAVGAVDRRPPRVTQSPLEHESLVAVGGVRERVAGGHAVVVVAAPVVDTDAQHLAGQRRQSLRVAERGTPAAAVAGGDEQVARPAEHELPAVVVALGGVR